MAEKNENTERNEKEEKFQAKLKELLALAKKKKNVLESQTTMTIRLTMRSC